MLPRRRVFIIYICVVGISSCFSLSALSYVFVAYCTTRYFYVVRVQPVFFIYIMGRAFFDAFSTLSPPPPLLTPARTANDLPISKKNI